MPVNVLRISPEERDRLIEAGVLTKKTETIAIEQAPEMKIGPEMRIALENLEPGVAENATVAIQDVANATREMAEGIGMMTVTQAQATQNILERVSDALFAVAANRTWKRIKMKISRDRNLDIKEAELVKIE